MASFNGNIGIPSNCFNLKVEYSISQSIIDNESTITATGFVKRNVNYVWPYNYESVATMYIDGKVLTQYPAYNLGSDGYKQVITFTTKVKHDDKGKKKVLISFAFNGLLNEYYPTGSVQQEIELPTIPRVSDIQTDKTEYNIGEEITITTTKKADIFTDKVGISFGKTEDDEQFIKYLAEDVTEPIVWETSEDAEELYEMIPNDVNGVCKIFVETYNGEELIGTPNKVLVKLNVSNSNPIFENFDYEDVNPKTLGLTGDNKSVIRNYSNVKGIVSVGNKAIAKNFATMSKYRFVIGEKQFEFDYSDSEEVGVVIEKANNNIFSMYAIDSRKLSTIKQISPEKYLLYTKPTILNFSLERALNGVGETVNLKINGQFWNESFGVEQNALEIKYKYKNTERSEWIEGESTIVARIDKNNYSFEGPIAGDLENTGFNLENSYDIEVIVADKLDYTENQDVVGSGTPNMAVHKNGTAFGSIYDEEIGGLLQIKKQRLANIENNLLKIYANYSLENGQKLLTEEGEIYSNQEVRTNKIWVKGDGTRKRVYRKRFDGTLPQQTSWAVFGTLDDIETMIFMYGKFTGNDGRKMLLPHTETGYEVTASIKGKNIEITQTGTNWFGRPCYIVVEYTKEVDYYEPTENDIYNLEVIIKDGDTTIPVSDLTEEEMNARLDTIIGGV